MNTRTTPSLRLFYALWPDDATRDALMRMQAPMQGRKTRYRNFHLTLAFLGQQPADVLPILKKILNALPPTELSLTLDRIGYFMQSKIGWAGMHQTPDALLALQHRLVQSLAQNTIVFNDRSTFRPHVTLARDAAPPEDLPFAPCCWHADQIALVESPTQPGGVIYRVIASRGLMDKF